MVIAVGFCLRVARQFSTTSSKMPALNAMIPGIYKHSRCRNNVYPRCDIRRYPVPDESVFWSQPYPDYQPPVYESDVLAGKDWADLDVDDPNFKVRWNQLDGKVSRVSFIGEYEVRDGYPMNLFGRTGLRGRGLLGRWGPNHAADPVVTKWKRDAAGEPMVNETTGRRILQMCAIERHDCGEWAIPGGMVDSGETVSTTLKREFLEEAMASADGAATDQVEQFFTSGREIYKGYVDDPRNTDNAWMETVAVNFHDGDGSVVGCFDLHAGDDAAKVRWMDVDGGVKLYASHASIVRRVADWHDAHW
ncbi:ADP-ribose pyrophosphatase, mitochondrial [Culex pipiens pallens]|uniref:ADP-ribose pyrophosphatase, mitochondrial n=1 Tax=Culex pipiens pallens TaxID=42434 RepID=UPI001954CFC1|nr:ADP-ribose pyrophosphatase, mitochondrial [Culex pipiens pallens]XP_039438484.1 ADP-ribose pyrophosphatase, mitochondrial [Culex pipiens pallens]